MRLLLVVAALCVIAVVVIELPTVFLPKRVGEPSVAVFERDGFRASDFVEACQTDAPNVASEINVDLDVRHWSLYGMVGGYALERGVRRSRALGLPCHV
jgi:hypothetical protein